jgi:hypothetical protein
MDPHQTYLFYKDLDLAVGLGAAGFFGSWIVLLYVRQRVNPFDRYKELQAWWATERRNWGVAAYAFCVSDWFAEAVAVGFLGYVLFRNLHGI